MNKIKRNILSLTAIATVAFSIFSCADNKFVPENEISYFETMDLWVKKNYPDIPKVEGKEGVYMRYIKGPGSSIAKPTDSSYVSINYSAKTIDGSYIATTDKVLANQLGTFSSATRYVPFLFRMVNYGNYIGLTASHHEALLHMSIGDTVEMVIAPNEGYYYSADKMYEGFRGTAAITGNKIAYVKMVLEDFKDNFEEYAKKEVRDYVSIDGDWSLAETGVYYRKTLINNNEADSVRKDSTLTIKYVGRFTDGFVFDTNIKEIAEDLNIYDESSPSKYTDFRKFEYTNNQDTVNYGGAIKAWRPVISNMRLGEKATLIAYPSLCYGATGQYNTTGTLIYTHTPLIFDIEIIKKEED